jgi:UDP-N-acetylglucosamine--N-acetylmuramyl-(pentapeptide) pyrophosphoryl-undecaprenol N-acetylglucosamine transferase
MAKIIIAGGGTGGHIFPAIAIANAIKEIAPQTDFLFIGAKGKMEMEKIPQAGYNIIGIDIAGFNRSSLFKNLALPVKLVKSFFQVRNIFKSFSPDAVIGVGGYSTFPVLRFAQAKSIKTFIHESNSFAGKANILLGKKCNTIFVATDGMERFFPAHKISIVGNPVRKVINGVVDKTTALERFDLKSSVKTVLFVGGSLGAKSLNEAVFNGLEKLLTNKLQVIWQTGKDFFGKAQQKVGSNKSVYCSDFITDIHNAYSAADIIVSRSGAMAIAEICVVGKPAIFVPYPFAAEDHQTVNAENLVNKNAGLLVKDADTVYSLISKVIALAHNEEQQKQLANNIQKLAVNNADEIIAKQILQTING